MRVAVSSVEGCEVWCVDIERVVERVTGEEEDWGVWRGRRTEICWGDCVVWVFRVFRLELVGGRGF